MFVLTEVTVDGVDTLPQTFTSLEEVVAFIKAELFDRDDILNTDLEKIEVVAVPTYPWEHKVDINSQNGVKYFLVTEIGGYSISTKGVVNKTPSNLGEQKPLTVEDLAD